VVLATKKSIVVVVKYHGISLCAPVPPMTRTMARLAKKRITAIRSWASQRRVRIQPRHLGFVVGGPREIGIFTLW